jgi:hypothetical protein
MGKKRVLISYGVDVDAVAGWLGSYGGEDSTSDISRGESFPVANSCVRLPAGPNLSRDIRSFCGYGGNETAPEALSEV